MWTLAAVVLTLELLFSPFALRRYLTMSHRPQSSVASTAESDSRLGRIPHSVPSNVIKVIWCILDRYLTPPHGRKLASGFIVIANYSPSSILW